MSGISFETLGNATIQLFADGAPLLVTDPWLVGTCYFGSWAMDLPPDDRQIANAVASPFVWISHGHPDHLHPESLKLFRAGTRALVADHYDDEIVQSLTSQGFDVTVMPYREWLPLGHGVEVLSIGNPDQDSILVIRTPDALIINLNDCEFWGEAGFLRRLVRQCPTDKTFLLALCDYVGDMRNIVDADGLRLGRPLETYKEAIVRRRARSADLLGVRYYCCSSFQHHYARSDSAWANAGKIQYADMAQFWSRPRVRLVEPFVSVDLDSLEIVRQAPARPPSSVEAVLDTAGDDWSARLDPAEWAAVETFVRQFETLRGVVDFVAFTVGGETREIPVPPRWGFRLSGRRRGIRFHVPARSLMAAVRAGYFDDLLLGNFMRTELVNVGLYPTFTPRISKYGGNAKIRTFAELRRFGRFYWRRNPWAVCRWRLTGLRHAVIDRVRWVAGRMGISNRARAIYWRLRGDKAPAGAGE